MNQAVNCESLRGLTPDGFFQPKIDAIVSVMQVTEKQTLNPSKNRSARGEGGCGERARCAQGWGAQAGPCRGQLGDEDRPFARALPDQQSTLRQPARVSAPFGVVHMLITHSRQGVSASASAGDGENMETAYHLHQQSTRCNVLSPYY